MLVGECGLTLDRAVSRILSPVVDMATETERSSRGLISDLQPQAGPDGSRSRAQYQTLGNSFGCLLFLPPKCTRCSLRAECFCNPTLNSRFRFFFNLCFSPQTQVQQLCMINYLKTPKYLQKTASLALSSLSFLLLPPQIWTEMQTRQHSDSQTPGYGC